MHQPQVLAEAPWVVYPGNTQGRHVREAGPHGCRLVTVDDGLEVVDTEFRPLDVVRWDQVQVDVNGAQNLADIHARIGAALAISHAAADGRLLAARVILAGACDQHAALKNDLPGLRAECINQAQMVGENIWIEDVAVRTTPRQDLAALAERDDLSRTVLAVLDQAEAGEVAVPDEVRDLMKLLPAELRAGIEADLAPENRADLLDDLRGILLDSLARGEV